LAWSGSTVSLLRETEREVPEQSAQRGFFSQFQHGFSSSICAFLMHVLGRELQQTDSLLQLRGERQLLG
jgi:hypothetical protein